MKIIVFIFFVFYEIFFVFQLSAQNISTTNTHTKIFRLDGNWELTGYSPDKSKHVALEATVPGQVHPDLQQAGLIPDPFWRDNAEQCQWPEHWEWHYKKTFDLPEDFIKNWLVLQFDGLDTYTNIYLNGKWIRTSSWTTTNNMFLPYEFNISENYLKPKGNVLEVVFYPIEKMVGDQARKRPLPGAFADPFRPYVRRMQCTFGWDWVGRFVTAGIWKSCRIVSYPNARVDDIFVYTKSIGEKSAELHCEFLNTIKNNAAKSYRITIVSPDNKVVWEKEQPIDSSSVTFDINLKEPQLWWPNGAGEHPLYRVTACLYNANREELHQKTIETGIRTVQIEELPDSKGVGRSFTIVVNGKRIFAKGGNWVPADPFPSRITTEKYALLLEQARDAGMNMLRIWGGGIYEPEKFWHQCNKLGIMVSQDFMLACQAYPDDDKSFVDLLKKEFTANARMIRNNPSLIYWCGDNELGLGNKPSDTWSSKLMHQTMTGPLMAKLDPSRVFRFTSPLGTDPNANNSSIAGDSHISAFYEEKEENYRQIIGQFSAGRFMSEHATAGLPPKRTLMRFMTEDDLNTSEMFEYHTKDNPSSPGGLTLFRRVEHNAENLYGNPGNDQERRIRQMEYLQYEEVRLGMEGSRRRKFYTSGIQFWMFNDCWPASGWSLIDYWGGRKASWYGMAAGSRPIIAASETTNMSVKWWITSDLYTDMKVKAILKIQPVEGKATWTKQLNMNISANSSQLAIELPINEIKEKLGKNSVLVCEISYENGFDRSYWTPGLPQDIKYPKANLKVTQQHGNTEGVVTITTDKWARVVTLDADLDFEDNYFEMLPGETRTIKWKSRAVPFNGKIDVSCWNL